MEISNNSYLHDRVELPEENLKNKMYPQPSSFFLPILAKDPQSHDEQTGYEVTRNPQEIDDDDDAAFILRSPNEVFLFSDNSKTELRDNRSGQQHRRLNRLPFLNQRFLQTNSFPIAGDQTGYQTNENGSSRGGGLPLNISVDFGDNAKELSGNDFHAPLLKLETFSNTEKDFVSSAPRTPSPKHQSSPTPMLSPPLPPRPARFAYEYWID